MYQSDVPLMPLYNETALSIDSTGVTHDFVVLGYPKPRLLHIHNRGSSDIYWDMNTICASLTTAGADADMRIPAGVARDIPVLKPTSVAYKCATATTSTLDVEYWG